MVTAAPAKATSVAKAIVFSPNREISTEVAVTTYGIALGVGTALAQLVAAERLSNVEDGTITVRQIAGPLLISMGAIVILATTTPDS